MKVFHPFLELQGKVQHRAALVGLQKRHGAVRESAGTGHGRDVRARIGIQNARPCVGRGQFDVEVQGAQIDFVGVGDGKSHQILGCQDDAMLLDDACGRQQLLVGQAAAQHLARDLLVAALHAHPNAVQASLAQQGDNIFADKVGADGAQKRHPHFGDVELCEAIEPALWFEEERVVVKKDEAQRKAVTDPANFFNNAFWGSVAEDVLVVVKLVVSLVETVAAMEWTPARGYEGKHAVAVQLRVGLEHGLVVGEWKRIQILDQGT